MALRISNLAATSDAPKATIAGLAATAQSALLAGDLNAYRDVFGRVDELDDVHARYKLRKTLLEHGFEAARGCGPGRLPALYLSIARSAVEILEQEPREPILLNYAGIALYELWALAGAEALFRAAQRLDPALPHLDRNLEELAKRRRSGRAPRLPAPVMGPLRGIEARAKACATRAQPAEGLRLSLCMIVKDEEEMLPRCLAAARDAVDEIVVVDTGSTDRTVEIAESFGARVLHHQWNGSFADARNVSIDAATGDWLMYLDADEVLVEADAPRLRELTGRTWREAFFLVETNFTGELGDGTAVTHNALRMWRNRPEYRFEGRLHEQFAKALPGYLPERIEATTVRVEHFGYLGVVRDEKEKARRNIELLEQQAADGVDTAFQAFNLGSEYGAIGDPGRALEQFRKAWRMLEGDPGRRTYPYVPSLASRYVKALRITGDLAGAHRQADEGLALFPGFTDLVFEQACAARDAGDHETAIGLLERCLEMGDAPPKYSATVGCGSYLALLALADVHARLRQDADAERLLVSCLERYPTFLSAVYPLAVAMLRRGADAPAVVAAIESRVAELTPSARFLLGTALYEAGHADAAEPQFGAVLERQPGSSTARVALAEALLSQRRLEEAAPIAADVPGDDPCAPAARRSELFSRILGGDLDGAAEVLARGELPASDAHVFEAWLALSHGEEPRAALPAAAADLLFTILEALLRLVDIDAFAQLAALAETVAIPARERRERLAALYLRRGFLDSAADEWIAACHEGGPDVAALVGLAQVASAKELPDDALTFAREARSLDPAHLVARRLVEHFEAAA
jgi:tetratricopeptide (TPR) repeat protein